MVGAIFKLAATPVFLVIVALFFTVFFWSTDHFNGLDEETDKNFMQKFLNRFYFSVITLSTVGYGDISPKTFGARAATCTLLMIELSATGLVLSMQK